ncbi:MAG: hypothetical protein ACYTE3_00670 [Planctomycetota bacterium]|jgi:hypothetical protein
MQRFLIGTTVFLTVLIWPANAKDDLPYTTYTTFDQLLEGRDARYAPLARVSDPGSKERPIYTGFFFYQCLQFNTTGRYLLGMRVYFEYRDIRPSDRGDVGYIDLKDGNKWTKIGQTTAWSWQQGPRLQWRPKSDEIVWNDRADDGYGGDGHGSFIPGSDGDWIISDTYSIHGFQYLFLHHRPSKLFVPLAKLKCDRRMDIGDGEHRIDLHPRLSRDGRLVSIDASYEGLGRQMYVTNIGHILDNPPTAR